MMKFVAMLKDSLRETIDSKVFFVVIAISVLFVGLMATLQLTPQPPEYAMRQLVDTLPDTLQQANLGIFGRFKVGDTLTRWKLEDLETAEGTTRPWEGEYHFTLEARDQTPQGTRMAILLDLLRTEEAAALNQGNPRKTRWARLQEDIEHDIAKVQEAEAKKGSGQNQIAEAIMGALQLRIEKALSDLSPEDLENDVRDHLRTEGNWDVTEVRLMKLPEDERKITIQARVPVKEENGDIRITTKEVEGEINKFRVTMKAKGDTYKLWPHKASLLFGAIPLGQSKKPSELMYSVSYFGVSLIGSSMIMLLSCVITAFYIPNMLRKGTVDLLLAKPIGRSALMLYKYTGGLTFMFVNTAILIFGLWLALCLRTGVWEPYFLIAIPVLTFQFAFFYALSTLSAVLTRSPIVSILVCVMMWGFLFLLGWTDYFANYVKDRSGGRGEGFIVNVTGWLAPASSVAHTIAPHYLDFDWLTNHTLKLRSQALTTEEREEMQKNIERYSWGESLFVTGLYISLFLGLACWRFATKDY
jgi:ABC-type transport system involved in multi-copper enzyme maturation permease subunit